MIHLSPDFIQRMKESIDIVDHIQRYTPLHYNGTIYVGKCPKPKHHQNGADQSPSFRVIPYEQSWFCGACHSGEKNQRAKKEEDRNYGSDIIAFTQWYEECSWFEAILKLSEMYQIPLEEDKNAPLYHAQFRRSKSYHINLTDEMKAYLYARGCNDESIESFMIGYNGRELTFPLINRQKQHIGFTKRSFNPDEPKYKNSSNSKIFNKSDYFYGSHLITQKHPEVYITEGAFDVILPVQYGVPNVMSTLGTSFTEQHAQAIKHLGLTPVICMDGDKAGKRALERAAQMLSSFDIYCKVLVLPDNQDLADLSNELKYDTLSYIQSHAMGYGSYLIQSSLKNYEAMMDDVLMQTIPKLKESLAIIKNEDEKRIMLDRIYRNTGIRL